MKNMIYLPTGRLMWRDVSIEFSKSGFNPKIWLGDPVHDEFAKNTFPECIVHSFFDIHKIIAKYTDETVLTGSMLSILESKLFFELKDKVYKIMDRQDELGCFSRLEREAFFYALFWYFYKLIKNNDIKILIASEGSHSPASMILYGVCEILNIPRYHLMSNPVIPVCHLVKNFYGEKVPLSKSCVSSLHLALMHDYADSISDTIPEPYYMMLQKEYDSNLRKVKLEQKLFVSLKRVAKKILFFEIKLSQFINLFKRLVKKNLFFVKGHKHSHSYSNDYTIYNNTFYIDNKIPANFSDLVASRREVLSKFYGDTVTKIEQLPSEYVFVPLHYEPEKTTNPDGGYFYNVYDMLSYLRCFVPLNIPIVLKEHYSQFSERNYGYRGRSPLFYRAVEGLGNIIFVDVDISSSKLIRECVFVTTQTGTAAFEASLIGKKSLIFGAPWFLGMPNVYSYSDVKSYNSLINKPAANKRDVKEYLTDYLTRFCLPSIINPSNEYYFKLKYADDYDTLIDDTLFSVEFVRAVCNDYERALKC